MLDQARMFVRYAAGLRRFLRTQLSEEDSVRMVTTQLSNRADQFIDILRRGIYENPRSPYRKLLDHARIRLSEAEQMTARLGVEGALGELHERGVYVTIDEFKTRKPIQRGDFVLTPHARDFDNHLLPGHYEAMTGGSRGTRTRLMVDLDLLDYEAAQTRLFLSQFALDKMPAAMWREPPPGMVGIKNWLRYARIGRRFEKWFARRKTVTRAEDLRFQFFMSATAFIGGLYDQSMPKVEHVPPGDALQIVHWLAQKKAEGTPALMDTNPSTAVRTCSVALEERLDIAGSFFRISGEPFTPAKARVVEAAGCRAASFYSIAEVGYIGMPCSNPEHLDEVHVMADKVAIIQRQRQVGNGGPRVPSLHITTVIRSCPKLMLNVEIGDYAISGERRCGCMLERLGFRTHLHEIRSFEKLTAAGNTFLGPELIELVEEVLPSSFGGTPLDYQFMESEENGLPHVLLAVHPRLGSVSEPDILKIVLTHLKKVPGGELMSDLWRDSGVLRVVRREPISTGALKLLPLHILRGHS